MSRAFATGLFDECFSSLFCGYNENVPELSRFFGIVIGIFYREHGRPHFHAVYGEYKAVIDIESGDTLSGQLPKRAHALVAEWYTRHKAELLEKLGTGASSQGVKENRAAGVNHMNYDVIEAEYVSGFVVRLRFRDGTVGEVDLQAELTGPIFEPLRNLEFFRQFRVHPEFHTLVWPNDADFAPEFLHQRARVTA